MDFFVKDSFFCNSPNDVILNTSISALLTETLSSFNVCPLT